MNGMSETNKVILAAILGIIIGFGFGRFSSNRQAALDTPDGLVSPTATSTPAVISTTESPATTAGAPVEPSAPAVSAAPALPASGEPQQAAVAGATGAKQQTSATSAVSALDQKAGLSVSTLVSMDRQGWVVVHEMAGDKVGRILGAKHFGPATGTVIVPLKRGTVKGMSYTVMLHGDDGDISDFSLTRDLPLLGANGKPIMVMFKAL